MGESADGRVCFLGRLAFFGLLVYRLGQYAVSGLFCRGLFNFDMDRGPTSAQVIVVHRWQVVVNQ